MSPATDTALTVAAFVISAPLVLLFGLPFGVFTAGVAIDQQQPRPGLIDALQRAAALAVPPLLLFGTYIAAVVLACAAGGPTFYYPLIAVPLGFAAWYASLVALTEWVQRTRMTGPLIENPQAASRRAFAAATIDSDEQAVAAVVDHLRKREMPYPTMGLVADRVDSGWLVYAPAPVDSSAAPTNVNTPVEQPVFLVASSGRIEQTSSAKAAERSAYWRDRPRPPSS